MTDNFYRAFEDRHRGSRELIKKRLKVYLCFTDLLLKIYPNAVAIDLGCGRGEWLELLQKSGFNPQGVDLDDGMLDACHKLNLPAQKGDAITYLLALPSESQYIVSAFHFVEHISFEHLQILVAEALRVLKPGGLLIMETPNPENIIVATRNFYLDPSHQRPIPAQLLSFITEHQGFLRNKVVRLQESKDLAENERPSLNEVFSGASPDYAVIAQKNAVPEILKLFDAEFERDYGLLLEVLADRFNNSIETRFRCVEVKAEQAEATLRMIRHTVLWRTFSWIKNKFESILKWLS